MNKNTSVENKCLIEPKFSSFKAGWAKTNVATIIYFLFSNEKNDSFSKNNQYK